MSKKIHRKILKLEKQAIEIDHQISRKHNELEKIQKKITRKKLELKRTLIPKE